MKNIISTATVEMNRRYATGHNHHEPMIVHAEVFELGSGKEVNAETRAAVSALVKQGRAVEIYLLLPTSRADTGILGSGDLKANLDRRITASRLTTVR